MTVSKQKSQVVKSISTLTDANKVTWALIYLATIEYIFFCTSIVVTI